MSSLAVFLGGEGPNELGSRAREPQYQDDSEPGVVQALLRRTRSDGWEVIGATLWKRITTLRARGPTPNESQNVKGLVLEAQRAGAAVVAFVRDADGDPARVEVVHAAIREAEEDFGLAVIGGVPLPVLEAWILAMLGERSTESLSKAAAQRRLERHGVPLKQTAPMAQTAEEFRLEALPEDAVGLRAWLARAREVLRDDGSPAS